MGLLHPTRDIYKKNSFRGQGHVGYVINNDDSKHPDKKKRQRVQVRIPQLHRNVPDKDLPYANQQGSGQQQAGAGVGSVNVPAKGSKVWVYFEDGDPHLPYYSSTPITDEVHADNELLSQNYPNTKGYVDESGNTQQVNHTQGTITDTHQSGATIHRDADGNVYIYAPGNLVLSAGGSILIAADAEIKSHATGTNSIKGSQVLLNCSDGVISSVPVAAREVPEIPDRSNQETL